MKGYQSRVLILELIGRLKKSSQIASVAIQKGIIITIHLDFHEQFRGKIVNQNQLLNRNYPKKPLK